MTTIRVRDVVEPTGTDQARVRTTDAPSALDILANQARDLEQRTQAQDADAKVIDLADAQAVLRQRETNGGYLPEERGPAGARDASTADDEVIDFSDPQSVMKQRQHGGGFLPGERGR